jgi:hypothetical protein
VREEMRACPHHGPLDICPDCPERPGTTGAGFPHPQDAKGRRPLRRCEHCKRLVPLGLYNVADRWHCLDCVPLGKLSARGNACAYKPVPEWECVVPGAFQKK